MDLSISILKNILDFKCMHIENSEIPEAVVQAYISCQPQHILCPEHGVLNEYVLWATVSRLYAQDLNLMFIFCFYIVFFTIICYNFT